MCNSLLKQVDETRFHTLMTLQCKIMTEGEENVTQKIGDIILSLQHSSYECNGDNLEFNLYKLDTKIINYLFKCFENNSTTNK